jgi:hypothetical protein
MIDEHVLNPPPIVRQEQDVYFWHDAALQADKDRTMSNLKHGEALYHINKDDGFRKLGYQTMSEYVGITFNRSKSWYDKLIRVHEKFSIELNQPTKLLYEVGFGKLSKLVSIATEENVEELLSAAINMSQQQIDKMIKESKGLSDNESETDVENMSRVSFSTPKEVADLFNELLNEAREEYAKEMNKTPNNVKDYQALEIILANYSFTRSVSNGLMDDLDELIERIESAYSIRIDYEKAEGDH